MPLATPLPPRNICQPQTRYAPAHPDDHDRGGQYIISNSTVHRVHRVHLVGSTSTYILMQVHRQDSHNVYVVLRRVRGIGSCLPHPRILAALRRRHPESTTLRGILWEPSRLPEAQQEDYRNGRLPLATKSTFP